MRGILASMPLIMWKTMDPKVLFVAGHPRNGRVHGVPNVVRCWSFTCRKFRVGGNGPYGIVWNRVYTYKKQRGWIMTSSHGSQNNYSFWLFEALHMLLGIFEPLSPTNWFTSSNRFHQPTDLPEVNAGFRGHNISKSYMLPARFLLEGTWHSTPVEFFKTFRSLFWKYIIPNFVYRSPPISLAFVRKGWAPTVHPW